MAASMARKEVTRMDRVDLETALGPQITAAFRKWKKKVSLTIPQALRSLISEGLYVRGVITEEGLAEVERVYQTTGFPHGRPLLCPRCQTHLIVDMDMERPAYIFFNDGIKVVFDDSQLPRITVLGVHCLKCNLEQTWPEYMQNIGYEDEEVEVQDLSQWRREHADG